MHTGPNRTLPAVGSAPSDIQSTGSAMKGLSGAANNLAQPFTAFSVLRSAAPDIQTAIGAVSGAPVKMK